MLCEEGEEQAVRPTAPKGADVKTTVIGSYPKVAEDAYGTKLIGALNRWQKKELSDAELQRAFEDVTRAVIAEQEAIGIDIVTDGQIRWEDLVTPLVSQWSGVEIKGQSRSAPAR